MDFHDSPFGFFSRVLPLLTLAVFLGAGGMDFANSQTTPPDAISAAPCPSPVVDTAGWEEHKISLPDKTLHIRLPKGWQKAAHLPRFYPRGEEEAKAIEADFWKHDHGYYFLWVQNQDTPPVRESRLAEEVKASQYAHCEEPIGGQKALIETRLLAAQEQNSQRTLIFYQAAVILPLSSGKWLVISGTLKSGQAQEQILHAFRTMRLAE